MQVRILSLQPINAYQRCQSSYIKFIHYLVIVGLICPIQVQAQSIKLDEETQIKYTDTLSAENTLYFRNSEAFEITWEKVITASKPRSTRTSYATHKSCVQIAKEYLGVFGSWGNGGRGLSLNSAPQINAVVIFTYIHVGVVKDVAYGQILLYEGNYDNKGSIRTRWMSATDPTIRGYHFF